MPDDANPRKRARTDRNDEGPGADATYTRGDLWYDDGNIILIAEDGVGFRVYKGILSQWSEVFRDMFTVPQPVDAEKWEGCAVVHLSDSSCSLIRVLRILFADENALFKRPVPFETVAAMLQLGTKYQIHHLRQEAIGRLEIYFPLRLQDFKNRFGSDWEGRVPGDGNFFPRVHDTIDDVAEDDIWTTIVLARALDVPALLPPSFYLAAQCLTPDVFREHIDEDGVRWSLSSDDIQRIIVGQEALRKRSIEFLDYFTDAPSPNCVERRTCAKELRSVRRDQLTEAHYDTSALIHATWVKNSDLCSTCIDYFVSHYEEERTKTWSELAVYFELKEVEWPVTDSTEDQTS
ncbi:hypothetical protein EIP91_011939 [Steccherinum ochraceum]|uniref:BTB domain-containing protein n=1 Tax=Steccherinum ochraceum TaxID=92696 RepID=A0A4R0RHJ5_9APHY|nr:hypothetical protein EIP91_011939 [Steccherinum ochraceum]